MPGGETEPDVRGAFEYVYEAVALRVSPIRASTRLHALRGGPVCAYQATPRTDVLVLLSRLRQPLHSVGANASDWSGACFRL